MMDRRWMGAAFVLAWAVVDLAAASANEALQFWREEWARQHSTRPDRMWGDGIERSDESRSRASRHAPALRFTVRPRRQQSGHAAAARYCVRTCDGYYFPLPAFEADDEADTCAALCPGASMEIFRLPRGEDSIEAAISPRGKTYAALPTAFAYRSSLRPGCGCGSASASGTAALLEDPTLRRGDIVVTDAGVRIFAGAKRFPYRPKDFVSFRKARGISKSLAAYLSIIDRPFQSSELKDAFNAASRDTRVKSTLLSGGKAPL